MIAKRARIAIGAAALLGALALALQLLLTVRQVHQRGGGVPAAVWLYLDDFTVLTDVLLTVVLAIAARGPRGRPGRALTQPASLTAIAASSLIVGLVYHLVLCSSWHPTGWQRLADELLHVVMPVLAWLLYPLGYLGYAWARGGVDGHYPYPVLNLARLGCRRCCSTPPLSP